MIICYTNIRKHINLNKKRSVHHELIIVFAAESPELCSSLQFQAEAYLYKNERRRTSRAEQRDC